MLGGRPHRLQLRGEVVGLEDVHQLGFRDVPVVVLVEDGERELQLLLLVRLRELRKPQQQLAHVHPP